MQGSLHLVPRGRDVVIEQVRIVGLALRPVALVALVVIGIVTVPIAVDIVRGNAASWFDSDDWSPIGLFTFLLPFAVWRGERRFGPAFLWTLPVDRRRLALAKVIAGWTWLMVAVAALVLWQTVLALLSGVEGAQTIPFVSFVGTTATYLLGSALVLGLRYPLRWLLGTASVVFVAGMLNETIGRDLYGLDALVGSSRFSFAAEAAAPYWPLLLLIAGVAALWAALSRHTETR